MSDSRSDISPSERTDPAFYEALGRAIQVLRTDQGMGRRDLSTRSGLSYSYLSEIENGTKRSSSSALLKIANALGMQLNELIMAAEERMEPPGTLQDSVAEPIAGPVQTQLVRSPAVDFEDEGALFGEDRTEAPPTQPRMRHGRISSGGRRSSRDEREIAHFLAELEHILRRLGPEDRDRLLDFARRLMR